MEIIHVQSNLRSEFIDITSEIQNMVTARGWESGILLVYCPHTTGAITVNENCDPDVQRDLVFSMDEKFPEDPRYRHAEGNSDSHLKTSLIGPSQSFIIEHGQVELGTWQGIYFTEWDGPRKRNIWLQFVGT